MVDFFHSIIYWIDASKYVLLFVGCIVEGPVLMVASGFIYRLGGFEFLPMYLALVFGDFTADVGWYFVGRFGARNLVLRYGHHLGVTPESIEKVQDRFHKYHEKILIISKLTMGFGFAIVTLMVAGMLHTPFKKYVVINLLGGFIWTAMLLVIGYFFGNIYALISGPEKVVFAVVVLVGWVGILRLANIYLIKQNV